MSDKYLNIDLNDPRASAIADVMGNKTAKRILDLIAEKEVSESDIAAQLKLPLNTVGYNIDKLLKAELIEKSKTFFWSVKGKKIPTYTLSNKKILISPRKLVVSPIAIIASIIGVVLLIALFSMDFGSNSNVNLGGNGGEVLSDNLKHFSSYDELDKFLADNKQSDDSIQSYSRGGTGIATTLDASANDALMASGASEESAKSSAGSYSTTNVQEIGIDEPDFVKNDGEYIYMISGKSLYIVKAYPAEEMKILANVSVGNSPNNMFVNGDKIVVLLNYYEQYDLPADEEFDYGDLGTPEAISARPSAGAKIAADAAITMPCIEGYGCGGYSRPKTQVLVYDISDKDSPELVQNYTFDGNYMNARMSGNYVYTISQDYMPGASPRPYFSVNGVAREIAIDDVSYYDGDAGDFTFTTIGAINLENNEVETKVYLLGSAGTVYVSENNIYLAVQEWVDYNVRSEIAVDYWIDILPSEYDDKVAQIMSKEDYEYVYERESALVNLVYEHSNSLDKEEQSEFNKQVQNVYDEIAAEVAKKYEKTIIHKVEFDGLDIEYQTSGEVSGYLLNQFSLDEHEGNLRVAVTTAGSSSNSMNHLYVLDESMQVIGKVENLAEGENIYSARFIGDRLYLVTFRQTDPFYVIDLSDAQSPAVLGYLKITGYSGYLHPYDENHIIGVGMEATEEGRTTGLKVALFDVSDVVNPVQKAQYTLELDEKWSYSYSDALYDHKAFLFDKEKNLLVIPVQYSYYSGSIYENWNGAYVFYIDTESIELDATISHIEPYTPKYSAARDAEIGEEREDSQGNVWTKIKDDVWQSDKYNPNYYEDGKSYILIYNPAINNQSNEFIDYLPGGVNYSPYNDQWNKRIQRSLFMDDTLYTVSLGMIKANSLDDFREIGSVEIEYEEPYYNPYILY